MPRDIPVGNENMLLSFDKNYILREFYFPHIGEENHSAGEPFRFGVWVNSKFSWMNEGWQINMDYLDDTLVTNVELVNRNLDIRIVANDCVDFHENIYVKKITVQNMSNEEKDVRIFLCHDFHIYGNDIGETSAFRPEVNGLLHYKGERYFLINACANKKCGVDQFAAGNKGQQAGSVSPLTWSHGTYIAVIQEYLNKLLEIEKCNACKQSKFSKYKRKG